VSRTEDPLKTLTARIDELETRTAFQDDLLHSLNDVIAEQDSRMAALARLLEDIREQISTQNRGDTGGASSATDYEPPPHY